VEIKSQRSSWEIKVIFWKVPPWRLLLKPLAPKLNLLSKNLIAHSFLSVLSQIVKLNKVLKFWLIKL
jgi:hypothetical protein